jgi:hypothetical protein
VPDIPSRLELAVGEPWTFEFPGLATAGYRWEHEVSGDADVVDVSWAQGDQPGTPQRSPGSSRPEVVTVTGHRPGAVTLRIFQHRRWEPADQVRVQHDLSIRVLEAPPGDAI